MKRVLALTVLFLGCKKEYHSSLAGETLIYNFFPNEQACLDAQPGGMFINCHQEIRFGTEGRAEIMLTDIMWRGKYVQMGNMILVKFEANTELLSGEKTIVLKNANSFNFLGKEWRRFKGPTSWDLY